MISDVQPPEKGQSHSSPNVTKRDELKTTYDIIREFYCKRRRNGVRLKKNESEIKN